MSMTTTLFADKEIVEINREQLELLKDSARLDAFKRARICLHRTPDDPIHEMIIVMYRDSYSRPHRNVRNSKSYYVIEGEMEIVVFDENGIVTGRVKIGTKSESNTFICRLNVNLWHTVVPLSEFVVFLETNGGPFIKENEEYAEWSPEDGKMEEIRLFLHNINQQGVIEI